jgi:predicted DNA-binding transcriptional regulator AlpA
MQRFSRACKKQSTAKTPHISSNTRKNGIKTRKHQNGKNPALMYRPCNTSKKHGRFLKMALHNIDNDIRPGDERILRRSAVREITGISDTQIWRMEKTGAFPARRQISPGLVGWLASEVFAYLRGCPAVTGGK